MREKRILIIDDVPEITRLLEYNLAKEGYRVESAPTGAEALDIVRRGFQGLILLDLRLPDCNGLDLFNELKQIDDQNPVIIITAHGTIDLAIRAIRLGAFDFITKSENIVERLFVATQNAFRQMELGTKVRTLTTEMESRAQFDQIVTNSREMKKVFSMLRHVIDSKVTVLILGDSGTGKELVARAIHYNGPRRKEPFVTINCAGIPDTLLESELFGYEKGAFTGAVGRKQGKFELADGGSIFLDEIGEMKPNLQSKLLRVLQEREFERVGGTERIKVDVRIISATNRDLAEDVRTGVFREDLYYRLSVFQVTLPPLRERTGDIPLLANHFLRKFAREEGKPVSRIAPDVLRLLESYSFPGNVRQLENILSHAVVMSTTDTISTEDLPGSFLEEVSESLSSDAGPMALEHRIEHLIRAADDVPRLEDVEAALIRRAVDACDGNLVLAAKRLGISRATIYRKLERMGAKRGNDSDGND